jgi:hypothetical protein
MRTLLMRVVWPSSVVQGWYRLEASLLVFGAGFRSGLGLRVKSSAKTSFYYRISAYFGPESRPNSSVSIRHYTPRGTVF